jgi:hypothetical protein
MRTPRRAQWLCFAIALSFLSPAALAEGNKKSKKKKSIAECTSYDERELEDENGVEMTITNSCEAKLSCGIKWTLTCAPHTKRAKKTRGAVVFDLESGTSDGTTATTETCGFDGWEITDVTWSCDPAP